MTKEQKFYDALKDIFVGAKVEGESGYINLMKIKSNYFEKGVFPKLQKDVDSALKPFPEFKEELFEKLFTFFNRYFSESGSIYFRHTAVHQNIYEKVYTDDKDVMLFWKTHMLYYVKTDRLFKNLEVEVDGFKFFFDVSQLEHKKAFEKKDIIFEFKEKRRDGVLVFNVYYSERGRITKMDEILRAIRKTGVNLTEEILERAFRIFEKQSEVDYFINKNAKEFLREQFNIWLYQYVYSGESEWTEQRIKQLQVLKDIAFKIIDFISQFEDELVKIWNKPKFVKNSNYVISLDRISDKKLVEKIKKHKNFSEQVKEWEELGIDKNNPKAPIDTKYFKDLELEILSLFDDLDKSLDGWLIKSENYQALNTILPKFKEKVQTIYIDPPFNKEQDADYFYSVKYKDSSWITLLENRLQLAKDVLKDTGSIFVRCDYNGNWLVRPLMNEIFGSENFRNEIVINKSVRMKTEGKKFISWHDSIILYSKNPDKMYFRHITEERESEEWRSLDMDGEKWDVVPSDMLKLFSPQNIRYDDYGNPISRARIILGKEILPREGRRYPPQEIINELEKEGRIRFSKTGNPQMLKPPDIFLTDDWTGFYGYSFNWNFPTENSEILLKRVIESTSNEGDLVMDFFLGSGTTTAVAHKLKRKWIGVEMGEHFYTVVLPRMKEVLAGKGNHEPCGISKEVNRQGGGFFKYYELEQYEDTLRKVKYEDSDLFENPYQDPYSQYVFMKDQKMLDALAIDYKNNKVKVDLTKLYPNIDIPETISNILGRWIKKITPDYVELEDGEKIKTKDLDYNLIKPLIWW
ncbi:MAG: DNA methyltransferase [candidate division WOR-3 bacterium]